MFIVYESEEISIALKSHHVRDGTQLSNPIVKQVLLKYTCKPFLNLYVHKQFNKRNVQFIAVPWNKELYFSIPMEHEIKNSNSNMHMCRPINWWVEMFCLKICIIKYLVNLTHCVRSSLKCMWPQNSFGRMYQLKPQTEPLMGNATCRVCLLIIHKN